MSIFYRKSRYHRISRCDCPSCASLRGLENLAGPWSTWIIVALVAVGLCLLLAHGWSEADRLIAAAVKG